MPAIMYLDLKGYNSICSWLIELLGVVGIIKRALLCSLWTLQQTNMHCFELTLAYLMKIFLSCYVLYICTHDLEIFRNLFRNDWGGNEIRSSGRSSNLAEEPLAHSNFEFYKFEATK